MEQREDEFEHDPDEEPQQYDADAPENAEDTQETEDLEENEDLQENEELRVQEEEEEEEEEEEGEGEGEGGAEEEEEEVENEQEPEQQQEHEHEDEPDNDCGSPYSAVEETPFAEPQPSISASQSLPSTPSESSRRQDVSEHERERERDYRGSMRGQKRDYEGHAVSSRGRHYGVPSPESGNYVKLFIGYVPKTATEDEIRPVFEKYGKVLEVGLVRDKMTGQQRGCCFIRYETKEEADRAISALHNQYTLPGSEMPVSVKFADGELDRLGAKEHKLYVSNLHEHTTEKELEEIFSAYGSIENITILKNSVYQRGGSAFVKYTTRNMALAAIDALHDNFVMEGSKNPLVVRFAENKRRRVESDAPYPSYPPYNRYSSGYGSYGRTSDRNNPVGHRPSVGRHYERHRRGSGFDVSPDMVDVMQNSRSEGNGAWRSGNAPHKTVYGSRGLPYGEQVQAYDNQQAPMKQLHHPSHQYQQHMNQSFPTSQMHYPQQSSQHGYLPQMQQRSEHSGDTLSKYRSYMPPVSAQSQWKPQVAAATGHQYLNQSPQAVPYAASYIQNQSMPTTPVAMNQGVLPQAVANTAFNPQPQQQLMMQQASNPAFQYPAGQNATNQLMPQHMLQQSLGHQAIQGIPIQGIPRQMQVPFQNTLNPMIQPPAYAHAPQTLQNPMAQVPNQAIQSGQVSAQQQYLFPQQMPAMQHASSQFMQTGQVPQNIQYPNQQANAAVVPGNAASNLAMPSLNPVPTDPARGTAMVASGVPVNAASDWTEHTAPDGSKYYYNKATRVSQWDKPPEMLAIEQKQEPATLQVAPQAQSQQHMPQMNPQYPSQSLQAQHMQSVQPNMPKPQSSFAPNPVSANMVPAVAVTNVPQATAVTVTTVSDTRASIQSSASDWSEHTSPDGHKYYYNKVTKASQWDKPAELIAAEKQQTQPLEAAQHISKAM